MEEDIQIYSPAVMFHPVHLFYTKLYKTELNCVEVLNFIVKFSTQMYEAFLCSTLQFTLYLQERDMHYFLAGLELKKVAFLDMLKESRTEFYHEEHVRLIKFKVVKV